MQQLCITIMALLGVLVPILARKLRRMVVTPRLINRFSFMLSTNADTAIRSLDGAAVGNAERFSGTSAMQEMLPCQELGRCFYVAFVYLLFPRQSRPGSLS